MTQAETILVTIGNQCPACNIVHPLAWDFCDQCGTPLPALCAEALVKAEEPLPVLAEVIEQSNEELQDYEDMVSREVATEVLSQSPLYNKMITIPCRNGKGIRRTVQKRLIDLLVTRSGDLPETVSPRVFELLNGYAPSHANTIGHNIIGTNDNEGKVDIYTACDGLYSELGYHSCQDMLNEVSQIKELARSTK